MMNSTYQTLIPATVFCATFQWTEGPEDRLFFCRTKESLRQYYKPGKSIRTKEGGYVLYILDFRHDRTDPDVRVMDSYIVQSAQDRKRILQCILRYHQDMPQMYWHRTLCAMQREWWAHNMAYQMHILRARAADVDFNNRDEKLWRTICKEIHV